MSVLEMSEEQWIERKTNYKHRLSTIVIPLDISPGVGRGLLSRIDSFFSEVRIELAEIEGQKERVDSLIKELERSAAQGSNETARKKASTLAVQNYKGPDGQVINLYEIQRMLYDRATFLDGVVDTLNGKHSRLITAGGLLKLEKELQPHASID